METLRRRLKRAASSSGRSPIDCTCYYRIDIVVQGRTDRLAVECDGDRYHPPEKLEEDMARQAVLERMGWKFVRVRGSQFFRDPVRAMEPVFETLRRLGIEPEAAGITEPVAGSDGETSTPLAGADGIRERVVRRAAELRAQWTASGQPRDEPAVVAEDPLPAV